MKITSQEILEKIKPYLKKDGSISKKLQNVLDTLKRLQPKEKIYIYTVRGSGRYSYISEWLPSFRKIVTILMGDKIFKNDAPRGGMLGEHISFNKKEIEILRKRINYIIKSN
jgi:hypothetical protein